MYSILIILVLIASAVSKKCYWNDPCVYQYFSTKTPYDAIRGDIRDFDKLDNCEAVSFWSIHRHGNRNPGDTDVKAMKIVAQLKDSIIRSHQDGRGQLCAQDIELFQKWTWNETLEVSDSYLTGVGYEELYNTGKRIRQTYPHLLNGSEEDYYFRNTNEQRTVTSAIAFMHGLTDDTNLSVFPDDIRENDEVIRPYNGCDKWKAVQDGTDGNRQIEVFMNTTKYVAIQNALQTRLGIDYRLTAEDVNTVYELCRFYRSWTTDLKSPWCSVFTDEDLIVLGYRDDLRHYYRNGYGSWVNAHLGSLPLKDLYDTFQAATNGSSRKITSYFSHDTMLDMVYTALGLFKDKTFLLGNDIKHDRLWKTTNVAFASNLMFVLNRCEEFGSQVYRVQAFNNEKVSDVCPVAGCTWSEFEKKFQDFTNANLDFCSLDYPEPVAESSPIIDVYGRNSAIAVKGTVYLLLLQFVLLLR